MRRCTSVQGRSTPKLGSVSKGLFERLRERAEEIHVEDHLRARLSRGDTLRVKLGLDPTAPDIHVGHLVVLDVLRMFQDDGHTVVLIIGDYTAMIGDPSGRSETRPMLTRDQVDANAQTYLDQIGLVLDRSRIEVRRNSEWLAAMTAADVLRLMAKATLQQVLQREDFAKRIKDGSAIGAHEILYPFSQGYDSVAVEADVEIGGTDQLFNLLFGRDIQAAYGQPSQDIAVFPLLTGPDGRRMSKSLGNYIGISEQPEQIYGKTMSIPDELIDSYGRLLLGLERSGLPPHPRDAKAKIASELVKRLHGEDAAVRAEGDFDVKFRKREIPTERETFVLNGPADLVAILVATGIAKSRNDARRLLEQGGVKVNGEKVGPEAATPVKGDVVSARRRYIELK
jgi:tyrosyl-tRNA synthetase